MARRRRLPRDILLHLARHDEMEVAEVALAHPAMPAGALRYLSGKDAWRRPAIAGNPKCPPDLSTDPDRLVVVRVASHPNTPMTVLDRLSGSPDRFVREAVAANESATDEIGAAAAMF